MTVLNSIETFYWGLQPYEVSLRLQAEAWQKVANENHPGVILGGEIKPVITQGIRAHDGDILKSQGFEIHRVMRGGETTLHSPGQLVLYPVLNIRRLGLGVRPYVQTLLKISAEVFRGLGVEVVLSEKPVGLFTKHGKIGFCGLQIKNGISQHGLALNIKNDLTHFNSIISCGLKQISYDKLENWNKNPSPEAFFNHWVGKASLEDSLRKNQNQELSSPMKAFSSSGFFSPDVLSQDPRFLD